MNTHADAGQRMARTSMLLSPEQIGVLRRAHVMVFGLGGVGSYAAEALGRMGVGKLTLVDKDRFEPSNINRQLCALTSTVGMYKADVTAQRLKDINPDAEVTPIARFHLPESPVTVPGDVDIVVDAVDTVAAKLLLIEACHQRRIPVISCMGMGNRLDPTQIKLGDVFETRNCALSRIMRKELRKRGIGVLRCVYSTEEAVPTVREPREESARRMPPGSVAYVPSVAGLLMAYETVRILLQQIDT